MQLLLLIVCLPSLLSIIIPNIKVNNNKTSGFCKYNFDYDMCSFDRLQYSNININSSICAISLHNKSISGFCKCYYNLNRTCYMKDVHINDLLDRFDYFTHNTTHTKTNNKHKKLIIFLAMCIIFLLLQ